MYTDVAKNLNLFKIVPPDTFLPNPSDTDYQSGFIKRYFIRKSNDKNGFIYEVSYETSVKYETIPFWKIVSIKWRLDGTVEQVKESNKNSIALVAKEFPTLALYLPNLNQFYKS